MGIELIVNVSPTETRVARLEDGSISEIYVEREGAAGYVGNIYKGKIVRVLPGMQAAFVDLGLERTGFLYVSDIAFDPSVLEETLGEELGERRGKGERRRRRPHQIQNLVKAGQEIVVQVVRDPIGTKGARLTTHISLPGRYLVYMPTVDHLGISRRIENERERGRLREIINKERPKKSGFIIRTVASGVAQTELAQEIGLLIKLWEEISAKAKGAQSPALLHGELSIALKVVRDLFTSDVNRLVIDNKEGWENARDFIGSYLPHKKSAVELYEEHEPIFDAFGIEVEISRALGKKVWLKSGGYIIIDQAEALTAIDVNTGKFIGKRNLEETILKTNMEAAKEIAYQLRLRDLGGIIIIDFIDMERSANRSKVYEALKEGLKSDRARTSITKISDLGLIQMTRKRTKESLPQILCEPCYYCEGRSYIKSKSTICHEIYRELKRLTLEVKGNVAAVEVHPQIADMLRSEEKPLVDDWSRKSGKKVEIKARNDFHMEQFEVSFQ